MVDMRATKGGGGGVGRRGVRAGRRAARVKRKVRTSERREEKESGGSKRAKRASRLGLGVAAAAAVTVGRSGARGYVARRGARRRRERAAGGSIHPSAVFFSPCVARHHSAALDAARSVMSASVSHDLPPPSRKPRSASSRKSSYDAASSSLRFLSVCMVHAFFNCQGIIIIKLSFLFHLSFLFSRLFHFSFTSYLQERRLLPSVSKNSPKQNLYRG